MEGIKKSELIAARLKRASSAVKALNAEIDELKQRLSLVEIHNEELQELLNKTSADTAVIEEAISAALESLDELGLDDLGTFGTLDTDELEAAESFTIDGSAAEIETFENQEF